MCDLSMFSNWSSSRLSVKALNLRVLLPKITNVELTSSLLEFRVSRRRELLIVLSLKYFALDLYTFAEFFISSRGASGVHYTKLLCRFKDMIRLEQCFFLIAAHVFGKISARDAVGVLELTELYKC
jgi:hypothetical protein